jgi:hypothetical protein
MTRADFKFAHNFPTLTDEEINSAYETVIVMFSGVFDCWHKLPAELRQAKQNLCFSLLVGWWLLDTNPSAAVGVMGNGGMSLNSKSIGGTSLSFGDIGAPEGLKQLNSNVFGQKALGMLMAIPERFSIYA